jgi:hypothetical protein
MPTLGIFCQRAAPADTRGDKRQRKQCSLLLTSSCRCLTSWIVRIISREREHAYSEDAGLSLP